MGQLLGAGFKNFAVAALSTGYTSGATALVLATGDGAKLPPAPFYAVWWNATDYAAPDLDPNVEVVYVSDRSGDNLTVARGQDGTAAAAHDTAGKTYTLLATTTAAVASALSRVVLSGGPLADITGIVVSAYAAYTFPANFFAVGDVVRITSCWEHRPGSAFVSNPRIGVDFAGTSVMPQSNTYWAVSEKTHRSILICSIHSTTEMSNNGFGWRENGSVTGFGSSQGLHAIDTATPMTLQYNYRIDATGETLRLASFAVELMRGG